MPSYKDYDRATLDAQYNLRARHPDFQQHFDWWERESERVAATVPARLDVAYGDTAGQTLDLFPCEQTGGPVLVFIHGGYWQGLDKRFFRYLAEPLVARGVTLVNVNYDLAPQATIDDMVAQVRRAVVWAWQNGGQKGADASRLYVSGHSAGGHLTAMMMATDWTREGLPADAVKAGLPISGLFDLEPIRRCYLNEVIGMDQAEARRNSPLYHVPRRGPPLVAVVGGAETEQFLWHNAAFAEAWEKAGLPARTYVAPGHNHFTITRELADPATPLGRLLLETLGVA